METKKILIIEDDTNIAKIVNYNLSKEGFETEIACDGGEGLERALRMDPALVLLDVMLPTMGGFEICRRIREKSNVPIIMMTALGEEVNIVMGLELGADDYITKPFSNRELIARVKANVRRTSMSNPGETDTDSINDYGSITININRYEVRKNGQPVDLTLREYELLKYLAENEDKICSRECLLENVWDFDYYNDDTDLRIVDVTIRRLREKLEDDGSDPKYVLTKRGVGYYFHRA